MRSGVRVQFCDCHLAARSSPSGPVQEHCLVKRSMFRHQIHSDICNSGSLIQGCVRKKSCGLPTSSQPEFRAVGRKRCRTASSRDDKNQPDLIERLFSGLFGKDSLSAEEPGGMKRLSQEVYQQQQPATTTDFAALLDSDTEEICLFRPLLANTSLEQLPLRCVVLLMLCMHCHLVQAIGHAIRSRFARKPCNQEHSLAKASDPHCRQHDVMLRTDQSSVNSALSLSRKAYDAAVNGWSASTFHQKVDGFGAAVSACCWPHIPRLAFIK